MCVYVLGDGRTNLLREAQQSPHSALCRRHQRLLTTFL